MTPSRRQHHPREGTLIPYARQMRKQMTPEELHLWLDFLRKYPVRYRRQEIIGSYIVDFVCYRAKIVIELDGSQHYEKADNVAYDSIRTAYLENQVFSVIRFTNRDVRSNFSGICHFIDTTTQARLKEIIHQPTEEET